jgi:hypothetical protein
LEGLLLPISKKSSKGIFYSFIKKTGELILMLEKYLILVVEMEVLLLPF